MDISRRKFLIRGVGAAIIAGLAPRFLPSLLPGAPAPAPLNSFQFTFVGTGLDIVLPRAPGSGADWLVGIDGSRPVTLEGELIRPYETKRIVEGLPFGTHTVQLQADRAMDVMSFRPFGPARKGDDFGTADERIYRSSRAFTQDDGTTTIVRKSV